MIWRRNRDKSNREICRLGKETQSKITHDEDGALIGFGDVKGISCQGKAGFDAIGSHDYGREFSVATVISCVKIACSTLVASPVLGPTLCESIITKGISAMPARPILSCMRERPG